MVGKELKAIFEAEPRFARIGKERFPVLLSIFRDRDKYEEDISDRDDFPVTFAREFALCLRAQEQALFVKSGPEGGGPWEAQGLYEIKVIAVSNFVQCTVGAKLASVSGRWS